MVEKTDGVEVQSLLDERDPAPGPVQQEAEATARLAVPPVGPVPGRGHYDPDHVVLEGHVEEELPLGQQGGF